MTEPTTEFPDEYYYFGATYDRMGEVVLGFKYDIEGQDWGDEEMEDIEPVFPTVNELIKYILQRIEENNSI